MLPKRLTDLRGLNAVAFVRVSTNKQEQSPATQRSAIDEFARAYGLNIVRTVELTVSGKDAWRDPAVVEITEEAEAGRVQAVIVSMLDRMGRSPRTDLFVDDLNTANAVLIDAGSEMISGNPAHRRSMRTGIAEAGNERDLTRERVTSGIDGKNRLNRDQWGRPPRGFTRTGGKPSLLQIDPATIGNVVALYERYATGAIRMKPLAAESGINEHTLKDILRNPVYNGWVQNRGEWMEAPWRDNPPVSDALWEAVQRVRGRHSRGGGPRRTDAPNLFEGLFYCGSCDRRLIHDGWGGTGKNEYHRIKHENPCDDWGSAVRRPVALWVEPLCEQIARIEADDSTTAAIVGHLRSGSTSNATPMRFAQERRQIKQDLMAEKINGAEYDARLTALKEREQDHREQAPAPTPEAEAITAALTDLRRTWIVANPATKAQVISAMYEKVRISANGTFPEDAVTLSAAAEAIGLPLAMPTEFGVPERSGPPEPTRLVRIPIKGRAHWLTSAAKAVPE